MKGNIADMMRLPAQKMINGVLCPEPSDIKSIPHIGLCALEQAEGKDYGELAVETFS